jgi:hypothetical protein
MSRIDTGEYARFNLAGLNQGINLGENADRMRFAQDRAAQADQQQAFQNQAMMGEQAMRLMQIRQRAQAAADKVKAQKRQRQANQFVTKSLMLDDAQFEASREQLSSILPDASPELQRGVFDRKGKLDQIAAGQRHLDSIKASGQKLDERQVKRFEDLGLVVDSSLLMPTLAQKREAEEQERKDGLAIRGMEQGLIDPSEMEWFMRYATAASLDDELEKRTKAQQAQQEAAANTANTDALYSNARTALQGMGVPAGEADARIALKRANLPIEGVFKGESASAVRENLNQRIRAAESIYKLAQDEVKALEEKATSGSVTGSGLFNWQSGEDKKVIQEYEAAKAKADTARRQYEALAQQALGGGVVSTQPDAKRQRAIQLNQQGVPREQAKQILIQEFGE